MTKERNSSSQEASEGNDSPSLPSDRSGNLSLRLRHAIENKFPHPIACSFYQLRRINEWRAEVPQIANVLGISLEHLVVVALAEYLSRQGRSAQLNVALSETLRKPLSHGTWAGLLRDTMFYLRESGRQTFAANLLSLYFPQQGAGSGTSLRDMGDELVHLRNELLKKSAESLPTHEQQQRFKRRLIEFLQTLAFLKDYPLIAVKETHMQGGIKTHRCYLLTSFHESFEQVEIQCDLDLETMRVKMLNPATSELLDLYPFYLLRECPEDGCRELHLFRFERLDRRRIQYIAAEGHQLVDEDAAAALKVLLQGGPLAMHLRHKAKYLSFDFADSWHQYPVGECIDSRYQIVAHLRRGGMADVYKVRHMDDGVLRALKLLPFQFLSDQKMIQRFHHEAIQSHGLVHPNITRVYDYGEDIVDHYLVMELADGWMTQDRSLALDVGELPKPLDESLVLSVIAQACEGLDYIHHQQIVHRDVKPGNLLLFANGQVKLGDFGIAQSRQSITLTMTGLAMGTPEYMSPEQAEGRQEITTASDIYSLGIVMYEMLTGQSPFKRKTPLASAIAHLRDPVPSLSRANPSLSASLQRIVLKCLEKNPLDRFHTARELYVAITDYERTGKWEPAETIAGKKETASHDPGISGEGSEQASLNDRLSGSADPRLGTSLEREGRGVTISSTGNAPVPWWRRRNFLVGILVLCLVVLAVVFWWQHSPGEMYVNEAKWHPNATTLDLVMNDLRTTRITIDRYTLRSNEEEVLREAQIYFDTNKGTFYSDGVNIFIKVFNVPTEAGGYLSAQWLMNNRVTPETDPGKIWNRIESKGEVKTFTFSQMSTRAVFEKIARETPMPQKILDFLRQKSLEAKDIAPQVFLGVVRRQWDFVPIYDVGSGDLKVQCTNVYAIRYDTSSLDKLADVPAVPVTPVNEQWKWYEIEVLEEGVSTQEGKQRFELRVKSFESQYDLLNEATFGANRDKMRMAKYATAVQLLDLYKN